tara:strand:+ start:153 stop:479 length:327 start_codon:yes stop_codon:yes gene_type:complete
MKEIRKTPNYYIGKNEYEAIEVIYGFSCSFNVGNAVTYLLRAGKKGEEGMTQLAKHIEDIEKAIHHLQKEINFLHIDDLMKKGMSYKKAKETIEKINQLKKENEKRNI